MKEKACVRLDILFGIGTVRGAGVIGHWSLVNGHLSMVNGHLSMVLLLVELALELELLQRLRSLLSLRSIVRLFIGI